MRDRANDLPPKRVRVVIEVDAPATYPDVENDVARRVRSAIEYHHNVVVSADDPGNQSDQIIGPDNEEFPSALVSVAPLKGAIPAATLAGIRLWVQDGICPSEGSFLHAVLRGDIVAAVQKADRANKVALGAIFTYLVENVSQRCWGSSDAVEEWAQFKRAALQG